MSMQRFTRQVFRRQSGDSRTTIHNQPGLPPRPRGYRWVVVSCVLLCAGATKTLPGGKAAADEDLALQGHAKRYLRINEYLFHGTQKTTAIALCAGDTHRNAV